MDAPRKKFSGPAKLLTIFVALFLLSAGLCGVQIALLNRTDINLGRTLPEVLIFLGYLEAFVMLVCIIGIAVTLLFWIIRSIGRSMRRDQP
jgi:hypothetical protein